MTKLCATAFRATGSRGEYTERCFIEVADFKQAEIDALAQAHNMLESDPDLDEVKVTITLGREAEDIAVARSGDITITGHR
jgi:hypothetical protein